MHRLFIALLLIFPIQAFAVYDGKNTAPESSKEIEYSEIKDFEQHKVEIQSLLNTQRIDIIRLKEQFSIVREYNDDFLTVILWSLGVLMTLTIVLLGFNWFQNSRAIRRDLDSIKTELVSSLALSK